MISNSASDISLEQRSPITEALSDSERRKAAGIPDTVTFATKPKIGIAMVAAALDAGVPCAWV